MSYGCFFPPTPAAYAPPLPSDLWSRRRPLSPISPRIILPVNILGERGGRQPPPMFKELARAARSIPLRATSPSFPPLREFPPRGQGRGFAVARVFSLCGRAICSLSDATFTPSRASRKPPNSTEAVAREARRRPCEFVLRCAPVKGFPASLMRRRAGAHRLQWRSRSTQGEKP